MSTAWQPEMDHLRRRVEALEKMLCQGHPAGVACGVCRPEPVTECCTDGTCPTCAPLMAWTDYRKDYQPRDTVTASKAFFAGWEASREYHRDTPEPELVFEPCACKEVTLARGQLEKVTDSRYRRTTHYRECCNVVSPIPKPEPVPEWREWVTAQHDEVVGSRASALEDVLMCLSEVERGASKNYALARIVARCEREIGAGWQADPDRVRFKCGIQGLIDALPVWTTLGNRAASWLRDLTDGAE
jgi:hypothetical protein